MALILSLETATAAGSVALHRDGTLLACFELLRDRAHAAALTLMVEQVCKRAEVPVRALEAVAVSAGPGSYTGLRIGTATAKGLCYALDVPLVAVGTLRALAGGVSPYNLHRHWLCPLLDARRAEVYTALYDADLREQRPAAPLVLTADAFADVLDARPVCFFGDGAAKARTLLSDHPNGYFLDHIYPSARHLGAPAEAAWRAGHFVDLAYFEPSYLKEFAGTKPKGGGGGL